MTAFQHYELRCDSPGCTATFNVGERRADVTRQRAASVAWVHGVMPPDPHKGGPTRSFDYCPVHAGELGELKPKMLPMHARSES